MKKLKLYMITTGDDLDLPVAVAETYPELSKMTGIPLKTLQTYFCLARKPDLKKYPGIPKKYHTVIVEEEQDD